MGGDNIMTTQKFHYFEKVENLKQQEFFEEQNHCVLCGSVLEFKHTTEEETGSIKEEAHCPECEIRARDKIFTLN